MGSLSTRVFALAFVAAALCSAQPSQIPDSQSEQEVIGMVFVIPGNDLARMGFGANLTIQFTQGAQTFETTTNETGVFIMRLKPGRYRIGEIHRGAQRFRLWRHQRKFASFDADTVPQRIDIYLRATRASRNNPK